MQKALLDVLATLPRRGGHATRIRNALEYCGKWDENGKWQETPVTSLEQLTAMTRTKLRTSSDLGRGSLDMLEQALALRGLYLGGAPSPPDSWRDTLNELT